MSGGMHRFREGLTITRPLHAQGSWRWANEAKPGAQPKWGYVSTVPGDRLTLRVTRDPEPGLAGSLRHGCGAQHFICGRA